VLHKDKQQQERRANQVLYGQKSVVYSPPYISEAYRKMHDAEVERKDEREFDIHGLATWGQELKGTPPEQNGAANSWEGVPPPKHNAAPRLGPTNEAEAAHKREEVQPPDKTVNQEPTQQEPTYTLMNDVIALSDWQHPPDDSPIPSEQLNGGPHHRQPPQQTPEAQTSRVCSSPQEVPATPARTPRVGAQGGEPLPQGETEKGREEQRELRGEVSQRAVLQAPAGILLPHEGKKDEGNDPGNHEQYGWGHVEEDYESTNPLGLVALIGLTPPKQKPREVGLTQDIHGQGSSSAVDGVDIGATTSHTRGLAQTRSSCGYAPNTHNEHKTLSRSQQEGQGPSTQGELTARYRDNGLEDATPHHRKCTSSCSAMCKQEPQKVGTHPYQDKRPDEQRHPKHELHPHHSQTPPNGWDKKEQTRNQRCGQPKWENELGEIREAYRGEGDGGSRDDNAIQQYQLDSRNHWHCGAPIAHEKGCSRNELNLLVSPCLVLPRAINKEGAWECCQQEDYQIAHPAPAQGTKEIESEGGASKRHWVGYRYQPPPRDYPPENSLQRRWEEQGQATFLQMRQQQPPVQGPEDERRLAGEETRLSRPQRDEIFLPISSAAPNPLVACCDGGSFLQITQERQGNHPKEEEAVAALGSPRGLKALVAPLALLRLTIAKYTTAALLDTGCSHYLINQDLVDELQLRTVPLQSKLSFTVGNGEQLASSTGVPNLNCQAGGFRFQISPVMAQIGFPLVFGMPFFEREDLHWLFKKRQLASWRNGWKLQLPLMTQEEYETSEKKNILSPETQERRIQGIKAMIDFSEGLQHIGADEAIGLVRKTPKRHKNFKTAGSREHIKRLVQQALDANQRSKDTKGQLNIIKESIPLLISCQQGLQQQASPTHASGLDLACKGLGRMKYMRDRQLIVASYHLTKALEESYLYVPWEVDRGLQNEYVPTHDKFEAKIKELSPDTIQGVEETLRRHKHIFGDELPPGLPPRKIIDHTIITIPGKLPPRGGIYGMPQEQKLAQKKILMELSKKNFITQTNSPYGAPTMMVKKKDLNPDGSTKYRMVVNYQELNKISITNEPPLPKILDILEQLNGAKYFTLLDMESGFYQIRLAPEAQAKTAFRTHYGHYEFKVMPFGLKGAPGTFQTIMNTLLMEHLDVCCAVYLDDILIYSRTAQQHVMDINIILTILEENKLYPNVAKCTFAVMRLIYLGYSIGADGIRPADATIKAVRCWPETLDDLSQVFQFLGTVNYCRQFMGPRFADIAKPLTDLTRSKTTFVWGPEHITAVKHLKAALIHYTQLQSPDTTKPYELYTDASGYAAGGVLIQEGKPLGFLSKKFSEVESRYSTYNQELLAMVWALKKWQHLLMPATFTLYTDHRALSHLSNLKSTAMPKGQQGRWLDFFAEFPNMIITYKPGKDNVVADALSRIPCHKSNESRGVSYAACFIRVTQAQYHVITRQRATGVRASTIPQILSLGDINEQTPKGDSSEHYRPRIPRHPNDAATADRGEGSSEVSPIGDSKGSPILDDWEEAVEGQPRILQQGDPVYAIPVPFRIHRRGEDPKSRPQNLTEALQEMQVPTISIPSMSNPLTGSLEPPAKVGTAEWGIAMSNCDVYKDIYAEARRAKGKRVKVQPKSTDEILTPTQMYKYKDNLLLVLIRGCWRIIVPNNIPIRLHLLYQHHDHPTAGHFGYNKTYASISQHYYWVGLKTYVQQYVETCMRCQISKSISRKPAGLLQSLQMPRRRWEQVAMDFVGGLPLTDKGNDSILVVVDTLSKMAHFIATTERVTAAEVADIFMQHIVRLHGIPRRIISDRDPRFVSEAWEVFTSKHNIQRALSTAFHPQTDGQTERTNRTMEQMLRIYIQIDQSRWEELLPALELAYNTAPQASTGLSPFQIMIGENPPTGKDVEMLEPQVTPALTKTFRMMVARALAHIAMAQQRQKRNADKHRREVTYNVGDKVLLNTKFLHLDGSRKLKQRYLGPFTIARKIGTVAYELALPPSMTIHNVFHVSLLAPFKQPPEGLRREDEWHGVLRDGYQEYEIQDILDHRGSAAQREFLIRWRGLPESETSWEPKKHLTNCRAKVRAYWRGVTQQLQRRYPIIEGEEMEAYATTQTPEPG